MDGEPDTCADTAAAAPVGGTGNRTTERRVGLLGGQSFTDVDQHVGQRYGKRIADRGQQFTRRFLASTFHLGQVAQAHTRTVRHLT